MQKPDLNNMWEFFIKIPAMVDLSLLYDTIRFKIRPAILQLKNDGKIEWYSFLVHNRESGVPTTEDDKSPYLHVRVSFKSSHVIDREDLNKLLPDYCQKQLTRQCKDVGSILGIETSLLKEEDIGEAWRIIGEQSEWVMKMLTIFKDNVQVPCTQIGQFLHYYSNMTQLRIQ
jgi:hypothetical protein